MTAADGGAGADARPAPIAFIDLAAQQARIRDRLDAAIAGVLARGDYIMGAEVAAFERALEAFTGAPRALSCANGTDALLLILMGLRLRGGAAVFCPSYTFAATAEVVPCMGATPVFVDIDPVTFAMDPASLARAIDHARALGLRPAGVIPVDLFGLPADYDALGAVARAEGLWVLADAAQSLGARRGDRAVGTLAPMTTTSFFPAKPLGCYGDGGALFVDDPELAEAIDSLRIHGRGAHKYDNVRIGANSRLDTLQAAILLEKLAIFPDELLARQAVADRYEAALADVATTPRTPGARSSWAQYVVTLPEGADRDAVQAAMRARGVPTAVYYPRPLHRQTAYRDFPADPAGLPASEALAERSLALPMHPYLGPDDQTRVISALRDALGR